MPVSPKSGEVCGISGEGEEFGRVNESDDDIKGEEFGKRMPVKMQDPKLSSLEEEREHVLTRLPYRSWCVHCVRGKGRAMDHRRQGDSERRVPKFIWIIAFLGLLWMCDRKRCWWPRIGILGWSWPVWCLRRVRVMSLLRKGFELSWVSWGTDH